MRKAMSLCFLLALALVFVTGCSKKKQAVQEEGASTEAAEAWDEGVQLIRSIMVIR